jgi:hypothetical protein
VQAKLNQRKKTLCFAAPAPSNNFWQADENREKSLFVDQTETITVEEDKRA